LEPAPPADDPAGPIDVLLVDDSPVVRRAVTAIVDQDSGVRVAGEADGIDAALAAVERSRPDVLLLDLELGREHGLDLLRRLRERDLRVTALVVSQQLSEGVVREVIGAGAAGFVVKLDAPRHLIPAIRAVRAGARYLSPSAATAR
jgi:DNA-binding NarL/FixJ family response regulator